MIDNTMMQLLCHAAFSNGDEQDKLIIVLSNYTQTHSDWYMNDSSGE